MTLRLRAIHRYLWFILALGLPAMWVAALQNIPNPVLGTPFAAMLPSAMPVLVGQNETTNFLINLRTDSTFRKVQMEIFIKKPLSTPVLNVYWNEQPVGMLSSKGLYRFALDSAALYGVLQIRDEVRHQTIAEIHFPPNEK